MVKFKIQAIKRDVLDMIMAAAKDRHPQEFACVLRGIDGVITEIVLVPGTVLGDRHALLRLHMLPIDFTIVGSAHTHPSPSCQPSGADMDFFSKFGPVHIIASFPYDSSSWAAYDREGNQIELDVV